MNKTIETTISGIKCNAEGCDYEDMSIQVEDYCEWVDRPCPKCEANLLTEADFELVQTFLEMTSVINEMFPPGSFPENEPQLSFEIKMDGSDIPEIGDLKEVEE